MPPQLAVCLMAPRTERFRQCRPALQPGPNVIIGPSWWLAFGKRGASAAVISRWRAGTSAHRGGGAAANALTSWFHLLALQEEQADATFADLTRGQADGANGIRISSRFRRAGTRAEGHATAQPQLRTLPMTFVTCAERKLRVDCTSGDPRTHPLSRRGPIAVAAGRSCGHRRGIRGRLRLAGRDGAARCP